MSLPILFVALVIRAYYKGEQKGEQSLRVAAEVRAEEAAQEQLRAARQAAVDKENERRATIERYVNTAIENQPGSTDVAILIAGDADAANPLDQLLVEALRRRGKNAVSDLFRPAFVSDGRAASFLRGDRSDVEALHLTEHADALVVGAPRVSYRKSDRYEGRIAAHLRLDLRCSILQGQTACGSNTVETVGSGFSEAQALENAIARAEESIDAYVKALRL